MKSLRVVVVADFIEPFNFNQRVLHGVAPYARMHGWELYQYHIKDKSRVANALDGADAVLHGVHNWEEEPVFRRTKLPMVGWSASITKTKWPRVLTDDTRVGTMVAEHLLARGFRQFAFYSENGGQWMGHRRDGFAAKILAGGGEVSLNPNDLKPKFKDVVAWLSKLPTPLGVMTADNLASTTIIQACRALARKIPDDVAVVAVNNDDLFCEISDPTLSAVPLQTEQIGFEAATLLAQLIEKKEVPHTVLVQPGELVVRRSSDAMAFSDLDVVEAMKFIKAHFSTGVATKQVVAHVGVSRGTLDTKFQAMLGRTVASEIRRLSIEKAKQLLSTSELPMPAVARHSGFSSARQFSETFHHSTGQTPTGYRRQYQIGAKSRDR
jgi:LacI family transcriptional regulator